MKIEQAHINQIRQQFAELQSKEDLAKLLSEAKNLLYGERCKPVQLKSLTYYANPQLCKKRYQTFIIKKKSGADRTINSPVKGLKSILRSLNFVLQCVYEPHEAATGFVKDKSIVDNAKKHVGHHYVLNIDLKDFFHSFDRKWVKYGFSYEPFYLSGSKEKEELAFLLASLCTHPFEIDGKEKTVLPQGSPTSPTLTNILCKKLDRRLTGLANRFGVTFTRYADDITFSSQHNIYMDEAFNNELKRIIEEDQKLIINPKKTRLQKAGYRQETTGLIVNEKVNVHRKYVKQIRMWLYYWEKYGYEKAEQIFKRDYLTDKGHVKKPNACLVNVLDGKLEFLKMVKGNEDGTYKGLMERLEKLTKFPQSPIKLKCSDENQTSEKETEFISKRTSSEIFIDNKNNKVELIIRPIGNSKIEELMVDKYLVKGLKLPFIEIFENLEKYKPLLPHNPEQTTILLTEFKNDGSGFKELVHKPFDEFTPFEVLDKVKNHPNFSEYFKKGKKSGFKGTINSEVQNSIIGLINSFERIGNVHWDQFKVYPFGEHGSSEYTMFALNFKKNYRFGPKQDGYTSLEEIISSAFKEEIKRFDPKLNFLPDERKFNLRGSFYTWVPSVKKGLQFIAQGINEHSNINGDKAFDNKEITFELRRDTNLNTISLLITDVGSTVNRPAEEILKDLRLSEVYKRYFRSICDWSIYLKNDEGNFHIRVLKRIQDLGKEDIIKIEEIKGFTHEITFYGT